METMDIPVTQLPPGDPRLVEAIVGQLKSKGIFDQFRKECLADVDTKPAFQNLRQRVEGQVNKYLEKQIWKNDMNKNQVREGVRKHVNELGILESGIDAIITQVVNPKIKPLILPYVEDTVYTFLQIDKPKRGIAEPEPEPDPEPVNEPVNQADIIEYSHGNGSEKNTQYSHGTNGPEQQNPYSHGNVPEQKPSLMPIYSHGNGPEHLAVHGYGPEHQAVHGYGPEHKAIHGYGTDHKAAHGYVPEQKAAHSYGSEPQAAILPADTEMVSSEEDEILARESPPTVRYTAQKPQEIKNEDENARDGFSMDTDSPSIDVQQDIIASNVEKLKLDDTYDESGHLPSTPASMKAPLQLFDNHSLDSISSNSSGLSSPKAKQISPAEKQNRPVETSSRHEESMEDENLSRSSTPLVDEKRVGVMDDASLISSGPSPSGSPTNDSDKMPPSPRYAPGEASPVHSVASNALPEKDNVTFLSGAILSGASPISQDEDSRISGGSFSRVSVASEKSDVEETAKSEKSEGEISSSSSESGESDTKSRLSEKNLTDEKSNEEKDSSQKLEDKESSQKSSSKSSSKDPKSSHRSHSREREKDRDKDSSKSSKDKEKDRKSSKSRDDHHSHRDKDKKHYRKDKDHDGDRDKSHHHSSSSSHRDGSGSSSNKTSDKDKSSHKSSGDKSEGQTKRESSHEKSERKHSSSSKSSDSKSSNKSDKKSSSEKQSSNKHRRDSKDEKSKSHRDHHRHDSKERKSKKEEEISKEKSNSSSRHESKSSSSKTSKSSSHSSSSSSSSNNRKRHSSDSRRSESRNISKEKEQTVVANSDKINKPSETSAMADDNSEDRESRDANSGLASNKEITKDANMNIKSYGKGKLALFRCGEENSETSNSEIKELEENARRELASIFDSDDEMSDFEGFENENYESNSSDDDFDDIVPDFVGFENILTDQTKLHMVISEADLQGKVTMEDFLHCCRNLGAEVSAVGEEIPIEDVTKTLQVKTISRGIDRSDAFYKSEGKKRRYSTSSSASSSQSPTCSPKHKRAKLNSATQLIENNRVIVSAYALLTPEDDGNRTSSRDYEVDYSQRCNSYSPLSPASDSSADDGKHKLADPSRVAGDSMPQESLKSPKTFKNRGKVIIPI